MIYKATSILLILCLMCACAGQTAPSAANKDESAPSVSIISRLTPDESKGSAAASSQSGSANAVTIGTERQRGFINDNILHTEAEGDIHYSSYFPAGYDGTKPYALFITLPGWEGLYFQGVGANMVEDFGVEAINYNSEMIVLSLQLNDWGEASARQTAAITQYFIDNYNIDTDKVYLHGMSGGGETGSIVICEHPELYTAYLITSSKWDGDLEKLAAAKTPMYMAIGENDSYYGSQSLKDAYAQLCALYKQQGLKEAEIEKLAVLDVKNQAYFTAAGFADQHAGGLAFAHDASVMGWLFGGH